MANLYGFLLAAAWPLVKKVLLMLGIGWVTYEGLGLVATQATNAVASYWGAMPLSFIQIGSLAGIPQAIGITLGAIAARVSFIAIGKLTKLAA